MTDSTDTMETIAAEARLYECCILLPFPLGQKEQSDAEKEIETLFFEAGAKLIAKDVWPQRGLAYPINGYLEGIFIIYHYEVDPAKMKEVSEQLTISPKILRSLLIKPPKGYQITKFSEEYEKWLKERKTESERKETEKEAVIKRKVAEKAKRQARKAEDDKKAKTKVPEKKMIEEDKLAEELEKLISDDELGI